MNKQELENLRLEVSSLYEEWSREVYNEGMSWGELAYIENLNEKDLKEMYQELLDYFDTK